MRSPVLTPFELAAERAQIAAYIARHGVHRVPMGLSAADVGECSCKLRISRGKGSRGGRYFNQAASLRRVVAIGATST